MKPKVDVLTGRINGTGTAGVVVPEDLPPRILLPLPLPLPTPVPAAVEVEVAAEVEVAVEVAPIALLPVRGLTLPCMDSSSMEVSVTPTSPSPPAPPPMFVPAPWRRSRGLPIGCIRGVPLTLNPPTLTPPTLTPLTLLPLEAPATVAVALAELDDEDDENDADAGARSVPDNGLTSAVLPTPPPLMLVYMSVGLALTLV